MNEASPNFKTDVAGVEGTWPSARRTWSYSSLVAIESCEARWMLEHASYPDLWDGAGYPTLATEAAIFGQVVHEVIETMMRANNGQESGATSGMLSALVEFGGWDALLSRTIDAHLTRLDGNPRAPRRTVERLRDRLSSRIPDATDQVKSFLGRAAPLRLPIPNDSQARQSTREIGVRSPAARGTYVERSLVAESIRFAGRVDRLDIDDAQVVITDFKTGSAKDSHVDQLRLYALLWTLDAQSNPGGRPVTGLRIDYFSHAREIEVPGPSELQSMRADVETRVASADAVISLRSPIPKPALEICRHCQVKHLCDVYWATIPPHVTQAQCEEWLDIEVLILRPNGARSWFAETTTTPITEVLVRTVSAEVKLPIGERIRLLNVRRGHDADDTDLSVITMANSSEFYQVSPKTDDDFMTGGARHHRRSPGV